MTYMTAIDTTLAGLAPIGVTAPKTMIVVPCYNEADRLNAAAFLEVLQAFPALSFVFVNDGSRDATLQRLQTMQIANRAQIEVISLHQNSGKAEAVRAGLQFATESGADFVGYWDADLATPLNAIADFVGVMDRYDDLTVVYGARRQLLGHRINRTVSRRAISRICAGLARVAVGLPISDTQCGAKLLRNSPAVKAAIATPFTAGWLFDVELFTRIARVVAQPATRFYEFPLAEWEEVGGSKVSRKAIARAGIQMLRLIAQRFVGHAEIAAPSHVPAKAI